MPSRKTSSPRYCSSIRRTAAPFSYVSTSNMPSASSGETTSNSIGRVLASESTSNAARPRQTEADPAFPLRPERVGALHLHERGEGFVEPDAVPPLHRHQVAEPHVGELVVDDVGDVLQLGLRRPLGIDEQQHLAERDAAEVLHRAEREVGNGDQVALVARVRDAVVVGAATAARTRRSRARSRVRWPLPGRMDHAERRVADGDRVGWRRAGRRRRRRGTSTSSWCRRT